MMIGSEAWKVCHNVPSRILLKLEVWAGKLNVPSKMTANRHALRNVLGSGRPAEVCHVVCASLKTACQEFQINLSEDILA